MAKTATVENFDGDKTSSDNISSFDLDVSDNPYNFDSSAYNKPPPPKKTPELPPLVVRHNPKKVGRYNLRPNPRPIANPDFRMLDSVTTEDSHQTQA